MVRNLSSSTTSARAARSSAACPCATSPWPMAARRRSRPSTTCSMAQYGVPRGLGGAYPQDYDDENAPYTPAWSERYTGIGRKDLLKFAREWGSTAEHTNGKCTIIIGAGINHWYHANLMYRAGIHALIFGGCVGVNGGGLAHYVGQEKLAPAEPWGAIALGKDWVPAPRVQNAPSWHYVHTDQWRYEKEFTDYHTVPKRQPANTLAQGHAIDIQVQAVRNGWLPFYPQFPKNPIELVKEARAAGAKEDADVVRYIVDKLRSRELTLSIEDPDAKENWPRIWYIWRGNALMSSSKGHEYFLKHYLGTHHNDIATPIAEDAVKEVVWHEFAPHGKMDLVVDLNFRMDTSALYSDIVLPAATFYEKADLKLDRHAQLHPSAVPGGAAVLGVQERLADLPRDIEALLGTRREALPGARRGRRHGRPGPRHPRRGGAAEDAQLDRWGGRADPRQDDARTQDRQARLQEPLQPVHLVGAARSREGAGRPRYALRGRGFLRPDGRRRQGRALGRQDLSLHQGGHLGLQRHLEPGDRDERRTGLSVVPEHREEGRPPARAPGREESRGADELRGHPGPAASLHQ